MLLAGKSPAVIRGRLAKDGKSIVFGEGRARRQAETEAQDVGIRQETQV